MKKQILLAAAASLALAPAVFAQGAMSPRSGQQPAAGAESAQLSAADEKFVTNAAVGGMFEVQSSELAEEKAQSAEVKDFAEQMVQDHGKANDELKSAARKLGAEIPTKLDAKHAQMIDKLEGLSGAQFDSAYIQAQRDAHRDAVKLFTNYSQSDGNAQLTAWAKKTLPTLKEHQQHLQQISVGGVAAGEQETGTGRASTPEPMKRPQQ